MIAHAQQIERLLPLGEGDSPDPFVIRIIRRKVAQLVGRAGIQSQDREDLQQELLLQVLKSAATFDRARSHEHAYITTVVERQVASLLRERRAIKRDPTRLKRLDGDVAFESDDCARVELATDVASVVERLPDGLRTLAERLKRDSVSQVARDTNVPRTSLCREVRKLRVWFEAAGYCGKQDNAGRDIPIA